MALTREQITAKFSVRRLLLPVALGLGVIGYMLYRGYEPGHLQTLLQASPFWVGMSFLVLFNRDFGYIYRIRYITEKALGWKQGFRVIMLWEFASCALPSVAGGSTVASYLLYKEGIPLGKSIAQVMVTAMLDNLYFLLAVPVVVLAVQGQLLPDIAGAGGAVLQSLKGAFVLSYLLIAVYAGAMAYALLVNPAAVKRLLLWVGRRRALQRWRRPLFRHANELLVSSTHLRTKGMNYWLHASVSTAFVWTARYLIIGCLIAAFAELSLNDHMVIFSRNLIYEIVLFVSVTPGAAGFAEIAFPAFFGVFIGSLTTIVVLLYRLLTYYLYLVVGTLVFPRWAVDVFRGEKEENPAPPRLPAPNPAKPRTL